MNLARAPRLPIRLRAGCARGALSALCLWLAASGAMAQTIAAARYTEPTDRYAHGVLGDAIEWGALELTFADGRVSTFTLPKDHVFEDVAPRLADLIARALASNDPAALLPEVSDWRASFDRLNFVT